MLQNFAVTLTRAEINRRCYRQHGRTQPKFSRPGWIPTFCFNYCFKSGCRLHCWLPRAGFGCVIGRSFRPINYVSTWTVWW